MHDICIKRRTAAIALCAALTLAVGSASATPPARTPPASLAAAARASATHAAAKVWQGAQDVALFALGMIGVDYRFGGETPDRGLDCSGLIRYVFQEVTGVTLPRTAREMSRLGDKIAPADLAPGDLVFFNTRRFAFSHVGLYLGDNRFIHAPSTGGEVEIATLSQAYWQRHFDGARRLVGVLPSLVPTMIDSAVAAAPAVAPEPGIGAAAIDSAP
ncbi:MAG TPA: C40 family peptidase [Casimicrobiaceae bacterium]|nr:C40 family peptidase [Casimicrobiaceae bacterium]